MSKPRRKCWSLSVGVYGSKVRLTELASGGSLYLLWVDARGKQQKRSLRHTDRRRGKAEALAFANQLASDRGSVENEQLTITKLFDIYEREGLHGRSVTHCREVKRKL